MDKKHISSHAIMCIFYKNPENSNIQSKKRLESLNQDDRYLILIRIHVVNMGYFGKYDIGKGRFYGALYLSGFNEPTLRRSVYR